MKKLKFSNSVYSMGVMGSGLDVRGGRLINNRPDGVMGIVEAASNRKAIKRMEKISMIADGVSMGYMRSEMMEGPEEM